MKEKLYEFDRVYNFFKDLTDKETIRERLDDALWRSYQQINCPYFREYEFAYAYAHLLDDYDKVYGLLSDINQTYGKYFDYRLQNAYAIKAMFLDSEETTAGALNELQIAEQMALEDNKDNCFFYFERWKGFIIAWQELFEDAEGSSRCVRHSISRHRRWGDIRDILAIAKAYEHLGDKTKAMYYMEYASAVATSVEDKHYIANGWYWEFDNSKKRNFWVNKIVDHERTFTDFDLNYDAFNNLRHDSLYAKFRDVVCCYEAKATTTMDYLECAKLWKVPKGHPEEFCEREKSCLEKAVKAISHPQHYVSVINYYLEKSEVCPEYIIGAMNDYLNEAQDIPQEHLGYLWLDCAEGWKALGNMEKFEECSDKSDVDESKHRGENEYYGKNVEPKEHSIFDKEERDYQVIRLQDILDDEPEDDIPF